LIVIFKSF